MTVPGSTANKRFRFRRAAARLLPSWLSQDDGETLTYVMKILSDAFLSRLYDGLRSRFPAHAASDALAAIARDRKIPRGIDESRADYAARVTTWLDDHATRGNPFAMLDQLAGYLNADVLCRTVDHRGNWYTRAVDGTRSHFWDVANWDWDGTAKAPYWARAWVIIYPPTDGSLWNQDDLIGDVPLWGGRIGGVPAEGHTIGSSMTRQQLTTIRKIVREWKPLNVRIDGIIIAFDWTKFDPTDPPGLPLPDGTWGQWSKTVAGNREAARESSAIYCQLQD